MKTNYGYTNARVRGLKSWLFNEQKYNELLGASTFNQVVNILGTTSYGRDLDEALIKEDGLKGFDDALRRNIMKSFLKMRKLVDDDGRVLLNVLMGRWDIANIKAILRGKNVGASSEAIVESLIPAGEVDETTLLELVNALDIRACIRFDGDASCAICRALDRSVSRLRDEAQLGGARARAGYVLLRTGAEAGQKAGLEYVSGKRDGNAGN